MQNKLRFDHILSYQSGGAVQEALPILFTPPGANQAPNPYLDLSGLLSTGEEKKDIEIDTEDIEKADGMMGEQRAILGRIQALKNNIDVKTMADPKFWLGSNEGKRSVMELQKLLSTGANDLKQSKEIAEFGFQRAKDNNSNDEYVTDLRSGNIAASDADNSGKIALVSHYELYKDKQSGKNRYSPVNHNQAKRAIQEGQDTPYESNSGLYLKNMIGQVKGTEKRTEEIEKQFAKAGSSSSSITKEGFDLLQNTELANVMVTAGFDPDKLIKTSWTDAKSSNINQLISILDNMINGDILSKETINGLRNAAMERVIQNATDPTTGVQILDKPTFEKMVQAKMREMVYNMIPGRTTNSYTGKSGADLTEQKINGAYTQGTFEFPSGDLEGLRAFTIPMATFNPGNTLQQVQNTMNTGHFDLSAIQIGNGKVKPTEGIAGTIFKGLHPTQMHTALLPYIPRTDGKPGMELAVNLFGGDKALLERYKTAQNAGMEAIDKAKAKGDNAQVKAEGDKMKAELTKILPVKAETVQWRPSAILTGYSLVAKGWGSSDVESALTENGSTTKVTDQSVLIAMGLKKGDGEVMQTTITVPLTTNWTIDKINLNPQILGQKKNKSGGKVTLLNIGGRIVSFNDLKNS